MNKGFELFHDIEDEALRTRNRAVVLTNLFEDHSKNSKMSPKGAARLLAYFAEVPIAERQKVQEAFIEQMRARGYALAQ